VFAVNQREIFRAFQFAGEVLRLVNQNRKALRTNVKRFFTISQGY
jgi:hypothetical protein